MKRVMIVYNSSDCMLCSVNPRIAMQVVALCWYLSAG
jgi:hypothetical protein